jgi:hypothetical protein
MMARAGLVDLMERAVVLLAVKVYRPPYPATEGSCRDPMGDRIKTIIAIVGLAGTVVAGFAIYDRFWQHPRTNIPRFESDIEGHDESSERFYNFLLKNKGKIVYFDVSLLEGITTPRTMPKNGEQFVFSFPMFCNDRDKLCTNVDVRIEAAQGVETQVFSPSGAYLGVKGYFFVGPFESHMNAQRFKDVRAFRRHLFRCSGRMAG